VAEEIAFECAELAQQTAGAVEVVRGFRTDRFLHLPAFAVVAVDSGAAVHLGDLVFGVERVVVETVIRLIPGSVVCEGSTAMAYTMRKEGRVFAQAGLFIQTPTRPVTSGSELAFRISREIFYVDYN
jgi:hypothetical protein